MQQDTEEWNNFVDALWNYQYVRNPVKSNDELKNKLYYCCQGIAAIAVAVFKNSQIRAITNKSETITPALIDAVFHDRFKLLVKPLEGLRTGNKDILLEYDDLYASAAG